MKRTFSSLLAFLLALTMLLGVLASCTGNNENEDTTANESTTNGTSDTDGTDDTDDSESESETKKPDGGDADSGNKFTGSNSALINDANSLANGVQAYFTDAKRTHYTIKNQEMLMNYARSNQYSQLVESIKNTKGAAYIQNTMDVFVRMTDGNTFYASNSTKSAEANLYRFGYYYYEGFFEFQNFIPKNFLFENGTNIDLRGQFTSSDGIDRGKEGSAISYVINDNTDPKIIFEDDVNYDTTAYDTLIIKAKAIGSANAVQLFTKLTGTTYNQAQSLSFSLVNDGEYHTYYLSLFSIPNYKGFLKGLRFDPNGGIGSGIAIESMTLGKAELGDVPDDLSINRHFHVYSDKMHHAVQFAATSRTENIAEIGMLTEIAADTVSKLIIVTSDSNTYDSLDAGFDWADVVAVGFDVKDAGIFGFILPIDEIAGNIKVELKDNVYVIEQTRVPSVDGVAGVIIPSIDTENRDDNGNYKHAAGVNNNGNDVYLGQRVYTDESHDFAEFLQETYFERNPLDEKRVNVSASNSDSAAYLGYNSMRGIYTFKVAAPVGGFYTPYNSPQKNYKVNFSIRSDSDRGIYVMTSVSAGLLECATLMDENMMLLPIPIEVIKNFSEATGERNLYNISDPTFSEAIFYIPLEKNQKQEYTIINLYQNWGKYPLKQLSQIPFHCPYYHLSTGVTETNCIVPWFSTDSVIKGSSWTLPDFRTMSAPHWIGQPQHNSCGSHTWLEYTPTDGGTYLVESMRNDITSYGPTYAEVVWENLSDDGKIKVTYTHMEMPQLDENRSYYTMEYEFLEDLTIESFKDNFLFYKVTDNDGTGTYKKIGYLNENNECVVVDSNQDPEAAPEYVLGDNCPYFSFFMMPDWNRESTSAQGYANLAFLIYTSEFIVGGAEKDYNFLIKNQKDYITLTLNESGTIAFKAGDKITINAILLPWGSQQYEDNPANRIHNANTEGFTDYTYSTVLPDGTLYMDKNVRDVRENTLLNPLTVKSETDEVLESPFLPKVKSKDGKTAEFTLSGGENNVTVRIYGFEKLTAPKVQELVDGEWVDYVLSSHESPDNSGNYHYYDGYQVQYDEDGTFSYSFVTTMYGGSPRTFRLSASEDFTPWPEEQLPPAHENFLNVYTDPGELHANINTTSQMYGTPVIVDSDAEGAYTSVYVKLENPYGESYSTLYTSEENIATGQYLVIKYRIPESNTEGVGSFQIWASTTTTSAAEAGSFIHTPIADNKWHVDVIDLSKTALKTYTANSDSEFSAKLLRIDIFNKKFINKDTHIDIAYIGIDSDLSKICTLEQEKSKTISLYENGKATEIDTSTGEVFVKIYIDPSSGYTESTVPYGCTIDAISGTNANIASNSMTGMVTRNGAVLSNGKLTLQGWCAADGGIEKYVYSIDGGKTWLDCGGGAINGSDIIVKTANRHSGGKFGDLEVAKANANFQASGSGGLFIDLSGVGEVEVDLTFAAIPKADTKSLILLFCFEGIDCTIKSNFVDGSAYKDILLPFGAQIDSINKIDNVHMSGSATGTGIVAVSNVMSDYTMILKGWCALDGGVEKYVWTADGGKTWNDCGGKTYEANDEIVRVGQKRSGAEFGDATATKKNGGFQGEGLFLDLSAYKDSAEPLQIYLCAVPSGSTDKAVIIYSFASVSMTPAAE